MTAATKVGHYHRPQRRSNAAKAVTRARRSASGRNLGKLPDPYLRRRPVYKKDARMMRQANGL